MSRAVVVTDSTADFPAGALDNHRIKVVPLYVRFGKNERRDGKDISRDEFFAKLRKSKVLPQISQPTPDDILEVYKKAGNPNVFGVHISSELSGTLQSANRAKEAALHNFDIRLVDSRTLSLGLGFLAMAAAEMVEKGESLDIIETEINRMIPKIRLYGVLDTLHYLEKGGRIGKVSAWIGSVLNIKPIIQIKDGVVAPVVRERNKQKAVSKMIEIFESEGEMARVGVIHAAAEEEAKELAGVLQKLYPRMDIPVVQTGTVIGTHSGPGLVGICGLLK